MKRYHSFRRSFIGLFCGVLVFWASLGADESSVYAMRRQILMEDIFFPHQENPFFFFLRT